MTNPKNELLFLALGGSGEIGMNVNLYGCDGKWIMVDLGMTFADPAYPGIELVLPDLSFIERRREDLLGIVITHGHEDHIGAIPYLAADLGVPLYATPFAAALIANKLEEEGLSGDVELNTIEIGGSLQLGPFDIGYVPLAHSIPESNALVIDTPYGRVFHTGDWKLDNAPQIGHPTSDDALKAIGDEGVLAMICDSTNVFNAQPSGSEATVRGGLEDVVAAAKGRVVVTTFASNAARLHTIGEVAKATGRRVCVAGRSLDRILRVARSTGYLLDFPETVSFDEAMTLPRRELLIVATGGQGEPRAGLGRIAAGEHKLKLTEGDTVVFSSRQIPGNELAIGRIMNQLARSDVITVTERQAHVHVSGHPARPELAAMYHWIRPEMLIPVHGEARHLHEHGRFALEQGIPKVLVQENGEVIRLAPNGPAKIGNEQVGRLILDGDVILAADGATMNQRRKISVNGIISVAIAVDAQGRPRGNAELRLQGVPVEEDREALLAEARDAASAAARNSSGNEEKQREAIRLAVRRCATDWTGKKPIIDVLLIRV
ncbi:MAG TPA: ribonuclease J [Allosphingosinicella sp.]